MMQFIKNTTLFFSGWFNETFEQLTSFRNLLWLGGDVSDDTNHRYFRHGMAKHANKAKLAMPS